MASLFTWSFINQSNLVIWCFRKLFYLSCQSIEVRFSLCDDKLHSQEFLLHSRWLSSPYSLYPRIIYISFTVLSPNTWLTEINMTVYLASSGDLWPTVFFPIVSLSSTIYASTSDRKPTSTLHWTFDQLRRQPQQWWRSGRHQMFHNTQLCS